MTVKISLMINICLLEAENISTLHEKPDNPVL